MTIRMTQQTTLSRRLRSATERTDLDQADVANLLGTNPRTVARWLAEESEPRTEVRRRLLEVLAVLEQLSGVLEPQAAHDWLFSPNVLLDHRKPIELLAEGDWRGVLGLIDGLAEGIFV
jgi:putative toxin-antitoxin system antitoxin component (TIGR02293 family)